MPPFPQKHAPNGVQGRAGGGPGAVRVVLQEVDHGPPHCLQFSVGPCGEVPVTGESAVASNHSTPGAPGRKAHTAESLADHLTVTSVETAELQSPWCGARPQACIHPQQVQRQAEQLTSSVGSGAGAATHKSSSGCPCGACAFPNFCLQKSLLKKNLTTVFAKSKHSC